MRQLTLSLSLCGIVLLPSCKKDKSEMIVCSSTLYGFYDTAISATNATFGTIDPATGSSTTVDTFTATPYINSGTFNPADGSYWTFNNGEFGSRLVKKTITGTVTVYTSPSVPALGIKYQGLTWNPVSGKLLAFNVTATNTYIVEFTISGSTFSATTLATSMRPHSWASSISPTIDYATGNIYFATVRLGTTDTFSIEKLALGSSASTIVTEGFGKLYLGLRFNKNDNMLYAMQSTTTSGASFNLVKINPGSGAISTLGTASVNINNEFYTTAIDHCTNRYILSTLSDTSNTTSLFYTLDMSGSIVFSNTLDHKLYQAFYVR